MMMFGSRSGSGRSLTAASSSSSPTQIAQRRVQEIFQSSPLNQCCADCTSRLSDSVWASTTIGAFLCIHCAGAHRTLGVQVSRVKSLHLDTWTDEDAVAMKGGNKRVQEVYAKCMDKWLAVDASYALAPTADTTARERTIRAKYEDMKFTKPPTAHQIAEATQSTRSSDSSTIVSEEKGNDSPEHPEDTPATPPRLPASTTPPRTSSSSSSSGATRTPPPIENQQRSPVQKPSTSSSQDANKPRNMVEVSKRFVNYFVVLGRGALVPNQNLEKTKGPTDIQFDPTVVDQFPEQYHDSPLPSHLAQFAFPEGYALSQSYAAPTFFSFVLTNVSGIKIYACALKFYEELHPLEVVSLLAPYYQHQYKPPTRRRGEPAVGIPVTANNQAGTELPKWVQDLSGNSGASPGPVFCPKCVVVMSHYPYFSAYRQFLQQVYRITLSEAPMPIERYITNFVSEIPLPPHGQIQVQLTLPDRNLIISRPPRNELPLADFSFRPLFQALDINNVLQLFTCAVLEFKIVLCSKHVALLTPVAESILSLLLPFAWQGAYIPVLPSSLLDVIDAPVPFLVGVHSDCMSAASSQSSGVVFIDLDHNRVVPAVDESGKTIPIPKLPERQGAKLRVKLFEYANIFDPFAPCLNKSDLAFPNDEHLMPIDDFTSERGHTVPLLPKNSSESLIADLTTNSGNSMGKMMRNRKISSSQSNSSTVGSSGSNSSTQRGTTAPAVTPGRLSSSSSQFVSSSASSSSGFPPPTILDGVGGISDSQFNETEQFSAQGVRKAFLRFFVTLFKKYASYLTVPGKTTDVLFDTETFLRENSDAASRPFIAQLIATQMFDRFVEDRVFNPLLPEVLFFDQSINQKLNRSLSLGKKKYDCSFLDDKADEIRETFIAPPPSNLGLPDDGTVYRYKAFPRLKKALFGNVRKPRELFTSREQQRNVSQVDFHQRLFTMSRCMKGSSTSWEATRRLIICLQTQYRTYAARKRYLAMRSAAIVIQRWAVAHTKGRSDRAKFLRCRRAAIQTQALWRGYVARTRYAIKRRAIALVQFFARGYIIFSKYQRAKRGFRRLQAQWRSSFHKRSYKNLKHQIIRVQSRVRGFLSRKHTMRWKTEMFEGFRRKIFDLWEQCDVPLLHRSKFWLTFNNPDFFNLGIYLEEERRLQAYFRETHAAVHDAYEYSTQTAILSDKRKAEGFKKVFRSLVSPRHGGSAEQKNIGEVAGVRIEQERRQLYDALKKQTSVQVRASFYEQFGIPVDSKKKKRRLASLVWTSYSEARSSAEVFVTVSCFSDRYHPLPAQIDRHKQLRLRDDLAFTVNAALKSIRYASPHSESSSLLQPKERELIELQHQVRMLAAQNHRLLGELQQSQRDMSHLQMELQLQQQPQLRRRSSLVSQQQPAL